MPLSPPRPPIRRGVLALATTTGLLAGLLAAVGMAAPAAAAPDAAASASQQAQDTGDPVPIPAETDAYSTVAALPDGSFQKQTSNVPLRVHRDNGWVPVDASLHANADGTYSPAAAAAPLTVSGGGAGALATLSNGEATLTLSWPTTLPTPSIDGDSALYADVLPDVDLRVSADTLGGLSDVLIVKTAAAAANPALSSIHIGTATSSGLQVSSDAGDNVSVTDTTGATIFHSPAPLMWDSTTSATSSSARAKSRAQADADDTDPGQAPPVGAQVSTVDVTTTPGTLALQPDQALLTGSGTRYPVYIDPSWTGTGPDYAWTQQAHPADSNWNSTTNGEPAVGYEGWSAPYGITRSFFQFDPGDRTDYHIISATFDATAVDANSGSADCSDTHTMHVYETAPISSSIHWGNEPDVWQHQDDANVHNGYGNCANNTAGFNVAESIRSDGNGVVTYRITAGSESDRNSYMRFSHKATLTINYNRIPNTPTSFDFTPSPKAPASNGCNGTEGWIGSTANVTAAAHISDPDGDKDSVQGQFQFWDKGTTGTDTAINLITYDDSAGHTAYLSGTGGTVTKQFSGSLLKNGHRFGSNVRAYDGVDASAGTDACYFWYDNTAPHNLTIDSTDFPSTGPAVKHAGQAGTFALSAADIIPTGGKYSKINHFTWSTATPADLAADGGTHLTPATSDTTTGIATATLPLTPTAWGINYLFVAAVDNAGNQSATTTYRFYLPDDHNATVNPGDVDNDGHPDLLAANSATHNLELYHTQAPVTDTNGVTDAADATDSPDGQTWANTLIAHRSSTTQSPTGARVDDLWAHKQGASQLYLYSNNINNAGGLPGSGNHYYTAAHRFAVIRPSTCADTCTGYATTWSAVTQLLAPGDMDGDGIPDIITLESGTLWLFPGTTTSGVVDQPHSLGTGYTGFRFVAPGDSTGDGIPDLWAVNDDNAFNLYTTTRTAGDPTSVTLHKVAGTDTAYSSTSRPLITSPGDADGDSYPDLYTTCPTAASPHPQLWANNDTGLSTTTPTMSAHRVIDDTIDWSTITNLA